MDNIFKVREITMSISKEMTYEQAGVDIDAGDELVQLIAPIAKKTHRPEVLNGIGGFGALCSIPSNFKQPVLVSGTDGVGTKLKLAFETGRHDTIGQDLVAMSVNDILVQGAQPLFFLDYMATSKLVPEQAAEVISGIVTGCELAHCSLIGGETAEMPSMYQPGEYDLAGFAVGVVEKDDIITGESLQAGDRLIGLPSSGFHSNGYSLIRAILDQENIDLSSVAHQALADQLLCPTAIYVQSVLEVLKKVRVKAMAHITGGGLLENIPRVLPSHLMADVLLDQVPLTGAFHWLRSTANVSIQEQHRVFNCGVGFVLMVSLQDAQEVGEILVNQSQSFFELGVLKQRSAGEPAIMIC